MSTTRSSTGHASPNSPSCVSPLLRDLEHINICQCFCGSFSVLRFCKYKTIIHGCSTRLRIGCQVAKLLCSSSEEAVVTGNPGFHDAALWGTRASCFTQIKSCKNKGAFTWGRQQRCLRDHNTSTLYCWQHARMMAAHNSNS